MPTPVFHIHSRTEIYESPLSPKAFGTDNWGKVNEFHRLAPDAPIGEGTRFEQGMVYEAFDAVFVAGQPWEVTRWFKYNVGLIQKGRVLWECHTREELLDRLNVEVRALYASMARYGFLQQDEIARRAVQDPEVLKHFAGDSYHSSLSPTHEIKLGVNEHGRLLFLDGRHRLAIAKILGLPRIPVRVVFVHPAFVRGRRPAAASDPAELTALLHELFDDIGARHAQPVEFLTHADYLEASAQGVADGPAKNAAARWEYYKSAIDFVRLCKPACASAVLELGAQGVPIVKGSDTLDPTGRWASPGPGTVHHHELRSLPWPLADKRYTVLVALRVFHHLGLSQRACFLEARRVARNIVLVVPEHYEAPGKRDTSAGITEAQFTEWNDGVPPTVSVRLPGWFGRIYFWNEEALSAH